MTINTKPGIVLHACCAVCLGYPHKLLKELGYEIIVFFYNPNIFPAEEYCRRRDEVVRFCAETDTELKIIEEPSSVFYEVATGLENEPEKGKRCERCFALRLDKTASYARKIGTDFFSTTLSVSPHKNFEKIKFAAEFASLTYKIKYLDMDFKKQNGFKITNEIAREFDFYRQDYCGCEYSIRIDKALQS